MASLKDLIVLGPARFLDKLYGNLEGNASTATKLQTPRAINGTNFDGTGGITTANWGTARTITISDNSGTNTQANTGINGSANFTLKLPATIKANLSGNASTATTATYALKMQTYKYNSTTETYGTSYPLYAQWNQQGNTLLLKCDNYTVNTDSASKLQTARTINGTSFDGSGNITTSYWGTARNIYIIDSDNNSANKSSAVSVNGNADITLKMPSTFKMTKTQSITVAGDANTYYPVVISMSATKDRPMEISIHKNLGSPTPSSYEYNHSNGTSSLWLLYEGRNRYWDGNGGYIKTLYKYQGYATLVSHAEQGSGNNGDLRVWLRGGGCYYEISTTTNVAVNVYYSETNLGTSSYPDNVTPRTTIGNGGIVTNALLGYGNIQGNATTASSLASGNTINGTTFTGASPITTSYWGTARNIYIQDSDGSNTGAAVSVNGGANATLKLPATIKATLSGNASSATYATSAGSATTAGTCTGNAATATKLQTARTINGTSFDGSANITTANWGTARTISISSTAGTTGTSVNGSANVSLVIPNAMTGFNSITSNNLNVKTLASKNGSAPIRLVDGVSVSSLGTSASDEEYLKLFIKNLCTNNPSLNGVFRTTCSPNSVAYIEVYIYNTSDVDSTTGLPRYCFGTWHQYSAKAIRFWTADFTFGMSYFLTSGNYSSYLDSRYVNTAGDTMTGALNFANGTWNTMGDDAYIGDYNQAGMIGIKGKNGNTGIYFAPYSGSTAQTITTNGSGTMTISGTVSIPVIKGTTRGEFGGTSTTSYALNTSSFICDSWIRSKGDTGWYNETYGGGWHMTDTTWIRAYNGKSVYVSNTSNSAIYTSGAVRGTKGFTVDETLAIYPERDNEINFGGTGTSTTIYMGYRATGSRAIPIKFIFGSSGGTASLQCNTVYLGSGTSSYVSSSQYTGNAATATKATQDASSNTITTSYLRRYDWWTSGNGNDVDTLRAGITFAYSNHNAPTTGTIVAFDCRGNEQYGLQIMGDYHDSANHLHFRNRNGDGGKWGAWRVVLDNNNYTSYTVTKTGSGASGTWGIGITGNAATATAFNSNRTIALTGDVTGSASTNGSSGWSISTTVADDSHNHIISNVDGLQTALDNKAGGSNYIDITVGGDANTYYPVVLTSTASYYPMQFVNISRTYSETAPDSWNNTTHKGGLTMTLLWNGSRYWDGNGSGSPCYCVYLYQSYSTMVGGLGNSTSGIVVWLRGGTATYHIHSLSGKAMSATVYTSTFTDAASNSFAPTTTPATVTVKWPGDITGNAASASSASSAIRAQYLQSTKKHYADSIYTSGRGNRFCIRQYVNTSSSSTSPTDCTYYEQYNLPIPSAGRSSNVSYTILTSKNKVTVSQGGTGTGSTGAGSGQALYNLGLVYSATEPTSPTTGMVWLCPA